MNFEKYTIKSQETLNKAVELAKSNENQVLESGHFLEVLLQANDPVLTFLLNQESVPVDRLSQAVKANLKGYANESAG
ncbi:MAG: hypothetical protein N4A41_01850, partial [Crocinitomicaceae bacterium]|nr:hypothetical protein [Crocinitomicaceae bacterium]